MWALLQHANVAQQAFLEKCAMTLTLGGALTTGIPIWPDRAGVPEGTSRVAVDGPT
jgi:hypothetical protein